ncbi:MAG: cytochrome c [Proteobacteria bacterium]|nr:cytochrome c [Pseudomonadota bacterium]
MLRALAILATLLATAGGWVWWQSQSALRTRHHVPVRPLAVAPAEASLTRGEHLVEAVALCTLCHGADLGGLPQADTWALGRLYSTNLTRGRGGLPPDYSDADFVRAIRHGLARDGRPLRLMPSDRLATLSDADVAAIIRRVRAAAPVDREHPPERMGPLTRLALSLGWAPEFLPAHRIDHEALPAVSAPPPRVDSDYGEYLVEIAGCRICHRADLSGGLHPMSLPDEPPPPALGPGSPLRQWSERDFLHAMRSGRTPDGRVMDPRYMPWLQFARMSDVELRAIWAYLVSL